MSASVHDAATCKTFDDVFRAELSEIAQRHNRAKRATIAANTDGLVPTTGLELTGLTCSGGGVRSAAFCLGVLQGLQSVDVIGHMDYLSTVSGGGYIGTTLTVGMSRDQPPAGSDGTFPFGRLDERRETPEVRHLRDNSRYLLQNGLPGVISALVIYLRGIVMNALVLLPLLLVAAAILVAIKPDSRKLAANELFGYPLPDILAPLPVTLVAAGVVAGLLVVYAILVSVLPIKPLKERSAAASVAAWILSIALLAVLIEIHTVLLWLAVDYFQHGQSGTSGTSKVATLVASVKAAAVVLAPVVAAILPFVKSLAAKASESGGGSWGDLAKRVASRGLLLVVAAIVPLLLWLASMQLAYWGIAVSACTGGGTCGDSQVIEHWPHAPALLARLFGDPAPFHWLKVPAIYVVCALVLFCVWPFLSVNSNSLHQLYRDRLGRAFLIRRRVVGGHIDEQVEQDDGFCLSDIKPEQAPYHLINTALNVPGSAFANRRGRNADFFLFSRRYIGSEATGYVETERAERTVDGLNIGTAMAISGAAAAPNMGMASVRPLSPTIAFLNVRLGRWVRHPRDIARRIDRLEKGKTRSAESHLRRIPGPIHLLFEAFSKSGASVTDSRVRGKESGFVFLTDGGHIENLGIYELLRRRCRLIIAIDAEADPDLDAASLVQVERFARIDMNVVIRLSWQSIGTRTRAVSSEIGKHAVDPKPGPHVAVGSIEYPAAPGAASRENGVLVYIKASLSGDENDYVMAYKAANPAFPHETTADQLFSEEQFEAYRALGEHIARGFVEGRDPVAAGATDRDALLAVIRKCIPDAAVT